jgi:hypothetical protein
MLKTVQMLLRACSGVLLTIATVLSGLHYTAQFREKHPFLADEGPFLFGFLALALAVIWLLTSSGKGKKETVSKKTEKVEKTGIHTEGSSLGNHATVMQAETINTTTNQVVEQKEPPHPSLKIVSAVPHQIRQDGKKWFRQYDGVGGTLVWVVNKSEGIESVAPPATGIVATLQFRESGDSVGYFQRVYWIDTVENYTTIKVGTMKAFVLGIFQEGYWLVYENDQDCPAEEKEEPPWSMVTEIKQIYPRRIRINDGLTVVVRLFSEITGVNFDNKRFFIDRNGTVKQEDNP